MGRPLSRDQRVVLCFRPEHFRVSAKDPVVDLGGASARDVAFFGPHLRVVLVPDAAPDRPLTAHFPQLARLAPGARTDLCVNADAVVSCRWSERGGTGIQSVRSRKSSASLSPGSSARMKASPTRNACTPFARIVDTSSGL